MAKRRRKYSRGASSEVKREMHRYKRGKAKLHRADEVQPSLGQKIALEEAPDPAAGHFRVPKVLA